MGVGGADLEFFGHINSALDSLLAGWGTIQVLGIDCGWAESKASALPLCQLSTLTMEFRAGLVTSASFGETLDGGFCFKRCSFYSACPPPHNPPLLQRPHYAWQLKAYSL